jgi:PIN domain nuclease of toxin-antitoxin system
MADAAGFLLDTNAWFWPVSQISAWELALKVSLGKIQLNVPVARWLEQNTEGLGLLDLPLAVIVDATHLPGGFHKDPADRFMVASARHHQLTLVTGDSLILDDAQGGYVNVLPV